MDPQVGPFLAGVSNFVGVKETLTLVRPSDNGKGQDLVGKEYPNAFWLSLVPLDKNVKKKVSELLEMYLPKCPICKSADGYIIGLNIDSPNYIAIKCKSCNAVLTSGEWDEGEGENHILRFESPAKDKRGMTLLRQYHPIKFWQKMKIEDLEAPEDIEREIRWLIRRITAIGINLPPSGISSDTIWRLFDPIGALAIRGLPNDPLAKLRAFYVEWKKLELEMEERAEERAKEYERIVFSSEMYCPSCNKKIEPEFNICPYCGARLKTKCPSCGKRIGPEFHFCPFCGTEL